MSLPRLAMLILVVGCMIAASSGCQTTPAKAIPAASSSAAPATTGASMELGNFSVSLTVKNLAASREFYEKLGFKQSGGDGKGYLIMQNATATIGLFQGMFEKNMLTFNPGWDRSCNTLADFQDVRGLQATLISRGITLTAPIEPKAPTSGPAYFMLTDPDGNPILIDQHTTKPK